MEKKTRQILVYPAEDGNWVAECPTLPGCKSQGETREIAIQKIREAMEVYVVMPDKEIEIVVSEESDETAYLLQSEANKRRLLRAIDNVAHQQNLVEVELEDTHMVRQAFAALKAAGGNRQRAGWMEWQTVVGEIG